MTNNIRDLVLDIFSEGLERFNPGAGMEQKKFDIKEGTFKFYGGGDWEDSLSKFEGHGFTLEHSLTCDGAERVLVRSYNITLYEDDSYDGSIPEILKDLPGVWKNQLRELYNRISKEQLTLDLT